ncbi:MAG: hypothetical protein DRJ26_02250 [Candidatus Methanomethylicota archaeon]|uniref:Cobalamin-independent methionine synthase MetE C-terminal/archaeal domain-containing protein n=1 Tax=Thermoproteota archaeon TaxID=2056631 RepID=A0A497F568_9CREN|nr:MAG: hypothetical protein DRJ26_02250 [Candidatus Verstraetearchaeota archaeon]
MLPTTTIGSFPLEPSKTNFRRALIDQIEAGVDYPALPQLDDFCLIYLREFAAQNCGIEIIGDVPWITSSLKTPIARSLIEQIEDAIKIMSNIGKSSGLKVQVTGALTLASVTKVTEKRVALSYPSIVEEFIEAITGIVKQLSSFTEVKVVFVDEPSLSYASWLGLSEDLLIKAISRPLKVAESKGKLTGVHVCGDVRGLTQILLQTSARILHHEFKGFPKNLTAYSKTALEAYDKMLGLGCVQTAADDSEIKIESVGEVLDFIKSAGEKFGYERLFLAPDCGFRGLRQIFRDEDEAQKVAVAKMKIMVEAADLLRSTLL